MTQPIRPWAFLLFVVCTAITAACGGDSSTSPGDPDGGGRSSTFQYAGTVSIADGTTGFLTLETMTHVAGMAPPGILRAALEWFEPRLLAQSGTATGTLGLSDGVTVALSGTFSGGTVQMSGPGGYSVTASVSGTRLTGNLTTPRGSGSVVELPPVPGVSVPANPSGTYSGTITLIANGYFYNTFISTGRLDRDCGFRTVMTGTLRISVLGSDSRNAGRFNVEYDERLRYSFNVVPPCPNLTQFEIVANTDPNSEPLRVSTSLSNLQVAFNTLFRVDNGQGTEMTMFVGAMTGNSITGRFIKSRRFGGVVATNNEHWEGWPPAETTVVLQKQ